MPTAESWQIGRDPECMAGVREAVKQQQIGRLGPAGLAIEDLETAHVSGTMFDGSHPALLLMEPSPQRTGRHRENPTINCPSHSSFSTVIGRSRIRLPVA
jgi:hypothetical protein